MKKQPTNKLIVFDLLRMVSTMASLAICVYFLLNSAYRDILGRKFSIILGFGTALFSVLLLIAGKIRVVTEKGITMLFLGVPYRHIAWEAVNTVMITKHPFQQSKSATAFLDVGCRESYHFEGKQVFDSKEQGRLLIDLLLGRMVAVYPLKGQKLDNLQDILLRQGKTICANSFESKT